MLFHSIRSLLDAGQRQSHNSNLRPRLYILLWLVSVVLTSASISYTADAEAAAVPLYSEWYNTTSGLWDGIEWWQSANTITTLCNLAAASPNLKAEITQMLENTLNQAPNTFPNFINDYYDDEGWWALAWIQAYDLTGETKYLDAAVVIFDDMAAGWGQSPCGGLWWSKARNAVNAIANELFLSVAAHLANRMPATSTTYLDWTRKQWSFFEASGMINAENNINDGLDISTCQNNGQTVFTYTQGVILGALTEYDTASQNHSLLEVAGNIASAAIENMTDSNGILQEPCEPHCDLTASQFKGVFARNLGILYSQSPQVLYENFIRSNADSVWANDRSQTDDKLGTTWSGPFNEQTVNATTQSSALDVLVAAAIVVEKGSSTSTVRATTITQAVTGTATGALTAIPEIGKISSSVGSKMQEIPSLTNVLSVLVIGMGMGMGFP